MILHSQTWEGKSPELLKELEILAKNLEKSGWDLLPRTAENEGNNEVNALAYKQLGTQNCFVSKVVGALPPTLESDGMRIVLKPKAKAETKP